MLMPVMVMMTWWCHDVGDDVDASDGDDYGDDDDVTMMIPEVLVTDDDDTGGEVSTNTDHEENAENKMK